MQNVNMAKKYIFNPSYFLVNDKNRILLTSGFDNDLILSFIHPVYAILISYFTGEDDMEIVMEKIGRDFAIQKEQVLHTILPLIENEEQVNLKYDDHISSFPERMLIRSTSGRVRKDMNADKYIIHPPYDFKTMRLQTPRSILFVVNTKCYTDCVYCYADRKTTYTPLETTRILEFIDEAKEMGIGIIDLSGGELLLHKDYEVIIKKLVDYGYNPYISTKVPVSRKQLDVLRSIGVTRLQYSIDSLVPALQKSNLGVSAAYVDDLKRSVDYADQLGLELIIKSTLTKETMTIEGLDLLFQYMLSLKNIAKYTFTPVGYSHFKSYELYASIKPTWAQVNEVRQFVEKKYSDVAFEINWDTGSIHSPEEFRNQQEFNTRALCTGNVSGLVVLPDGKVTICEELYWNEHFIIGDLTKNLLAEIWHSPEAHALYRFTKDSLGTGSPCNACDTFSECRHRRGVCWKEVMACYGKENWSYPDPRCPLAPEIDTEIKNTLIYV